MDRRQFLSALGAVTAAQSARAQSRPALSRPVRLGVIGTGNRGTSLLRASLAYQGVEVTAVSDLDASRTARAIDYVQSAGQPKPAAFHGGADAYRKMLDLGNVDAVVVASPEQMHAPMAVAALEAGKAVLSEVAAAVSIDDCWRLVEAVEKTRGFYMMAENCCYYRSNLAVQAMIDAGIFGELTYADCGYVHSLPQLGFAPDGTLTWRGELSRDFANWYPTHAIGPVARWLGIHKGDRFDKIFSLPSPSARLPEWARAKYGADSVAARTRYQGDATLSMIQTVNGKLIELRLDVNSARPTISTTYFCVQGTKGAYRDAEGQQSYWLDSAKPEEKWEPFAPMEEKYADARWTRHGETARKSGHGGADFFTLLDFFESVADRRPSPIDVYDAVAWSSIIALSTASVRAGGLPQSIPDFTRGHWRKARA